MPFIGGEARLGNAAVVAAGKTVEHRFGAPGRDGVHGAHRVRAGARGGAVERAVERDRSGERPRAVAGAAEVALEVVDDVIAARAIDGEDRAAAEVAVVAAAARRAVVGRAVERGGVERAADRGEAAVGAGAVGRAFEAVELLVAGLRGRGGRSRCGRLGRARRGWRDAAAIASRQQQSGENGGDDCV